MIKKVKEEHIADCVQLVRKSFLTIADEFGLTDENAPRFTAFSISEERLLRHLNEEHRPMYAAYANDTMIGYYSLFLRADHTCELNNLCVCPEHRHNGVGKKLLQHAFKTALEAGCVKMDIGIVEENIRLKTWYESFGFTHTGTKKFDFFPFTCGYLEKNL